MEDFLLQDLIDNLAIKHEKVKEELLQKEKELVTLTKFVEIQTFEQNKLKIKLTNETLAIQKWKAEIDSLNFQIQLENGIFGYHLAKQDAQHQPTFSSEFHENFEIEIANKEAEMQQNLDKLNNELKTLEGESFEEETGSMEWSKKVTEKRKEVNQLDQQIQEVQMKVIFYY